MPKGKPLGGVMIAPSSSESALELVVMGGMFRACVMEWALGVVPYVTLIVATISTCLEGGECRA